ncbi:HNH endonuclease [Streptomyces macrosporus]|uniref:HNH endonuclease n=1 Tax=Streptomyces macrosporus TaxID=44032 RepID=UPI003CD06AC2
MPDTAKRAVCTECRGPKPRPDRNTCGAPLCRESARLQIQARKAREAARAYRSAPACERCEMPTGRPANVRYCHACDADIESLRAEDERRARRREREEAAKNPCQGPDCNNPVGLSKEKGRTRHYCSKKCAKAAEYIRARDRRAPVPVPCPRCSAPHVSKYADGVCRSCQRAQRTIARRVTLKRAVREQYGDSHCFHCATPLGGEEILDHLVPVSRGGLSTVDNMRFVCERCNASKKDQLIGEWTPAIA